MSVIYRVTARLPFSNVALSLHRPAPHQRGFWRDRYDDSCTIYGLGRVLLYVERVPVRGGLLTR